MSAHPGAAKADLEAALSAFVGVPIGPPWVSPDGVNDAMIRHYCAVTGDENPVYRDPEAARRSVHGGIVAPPTMLDVWVMPAYVPPWVADPTAPAAPPDKQVELHALLDRHGYTGVVATNQEQTYARYLRPGDRLTAVIVIDAISEEKATPLGLGYFITTRYTFRDQSGAEVGEMTFRVLKFKPARPPQPARSGDSGTTPAKPRRLRPPMGHDNAWWWQGIERGEVLIQKCRACGVLRHPPRPMCGGCQSTEWDTVQTSGRGTVYSFTVVHHPKFPGYDYPLACVLVELEEGTRFVSNLVGCPPEDVRIGMRVVLAIENVDDELRLPLFRPAE
jgi:uncharacterized OB-fold protein/acyl dehydratase